MLSDRLWNNRYARWVALSFFLLSHGLLSIGQRIDSFWPAHICLAAGLILWIVPVTWCAYKYSKQGVA